ncbi:MAG TPA: YciI family protein [Dehalococcoidia bacterium]|nr:YciI family protein [Dehalococcoidia bacterium]
MKYVVFYGGPMAAGHNEGQGASTEETMAKIREHYPAHRARVDQFYRDGRMLLIGTFADPLTDGSMAIFASKDDAEAFVADDPFVVNGVVRAWRMLEWNEVLAP